MDVAQITETAKPVMDAAERLSTGSVTLWFVLVVLLFGGGIFWVIKLLLNQWEAQRNVAAEIQSKFFDYITKDHQQSVILQRETNQIMGEVVKLLESINQRYHDDDILKAAESGTAIVKRMHHSIRPDPRTSEQKTQKDQ